MVGGDKHGDDDDKNDNAEMEDGSRTVLLELVSVREGVYLTGGGGGGRTWV